MKYDFTSGSSEPKVLFTIKSDGEIVVVKEDLWTIWTYLFTGKFVGFDQIEKH